MAVAIHLFPLSVPPLHRRSFLHLPSPVYQSCPRRCAVLISLASNRDTTASTDTTSITLPSPESTVTPPPLRVAFSGTDNGSHIYSSIAIADSLSLSSTPTLSSSFSLHHPLLSLPPLYPRLAILSLPSLPHSFVSLTFSL